MLTIVVNAKSSRRHRNQLESESGIKKRFFFMIIIIAPTQPDDSYEERDENLNTIMTVKKKH